MIARAIATSHKFERDDASLRATLRDARVFHAAREGHCLRFAERGATQQFNMEIGRDSLSHISRSLQGLQSKADPRKLRTGPKTVRDCVTKTVGVAENSRECAAWTSWSVYADTHTHFSHLRVDSGRFESPMFMQQQGVFAA